MSDSQVANTNYANPFLAQDPLSRVWQKGHDDAAAGRKQDHKQLLDRFQAPAYRKGYAAGTVAFLELGHAQPRIKSRQAIETTKRNYAGRKDAHALIAPVGKAKQSWQQAIERQKAAEAQLAGEGAGLAAHPPGGSKLGGGGGTGTNGEPLSGTATYKNFSSISPTSKTTVPPAEDVAITHDGGTATPLRAETGSGGSEASTDGAAAVALATDADLPPELLAPEFSVPVEPAVEQKAPQVTMVEGGLTASARPKRTRRGGRIAWISGHGRFADRFRQQLGLPPRAELQGVRQRLCVVVDPDEMFPEQAAKHGIHMVVGETFLWTGDEAPAGCAFAKDRPYAEPMPAADPVSMDQVASRAPVAALPQGGGGVRFDPVRLRTFALEQAVKSILCADGEPTKTTIKRAQSFFDWCATGEAG